MDVKQYHRKISLPVLNTQYRVIRAKGIMAFIIHAESKELPFDPTW
jgi:hypothetical protein